MDCRKRLRYAARRDDKADTQALEGLLGVPRYDHVVFDQKHAGRHRCPLQRCVPGVRGATTAVRSQDVARRLGRFIHIALGNVPAPRKVQPSSFRRHRSWRDATAPHPFANRPAAIPPRPDPRPLARAPRYEEIRLHIPVRRFPPSTSYRAHYGSWMEPEHIKSRWSVH